MDTISLEGLEFFAYHGFFREERKMGNKFRIDLVIAADLEQAARADRLADTIDYGALYKIVQGVMAKPAKLLEHIALQIIADIKAQFPQIQTVTVSVAKYNPPVGGVCKWAKVKLTR